LLGVLLSTPNLLPDASRTQVRVYPPCYGKIVRLLNFGKLLMTEALRENRILFSRFWLAHFQISCSTVENGLVLPPFLYHSYFLFHGLSFSSDGTRQHEGCYFTGPGHPPKLIKRLRRDGFSNQSEAGIRSYPRLYAEYPTADSHPWRACGRSALD